MEGVDNLVTMLDNNKIKEALPVIRWHVAIEGCVHILSLFCPPCRHTKIGLVLGVWVSLLPNGSPRLVSR